MLGVFAEFEREIIIDRVRNGMERKAAKGKWTGGPVPYGYQLDRALDIPVPDQTEAAIVRQIFTAYADTCITYFQTCQESWHPNAAGYAVLGQCLAGAAATVNRTVSCIRQPTGAITIG